MGAKYGDYEYKMRLLKLCKEYMLNFCKWTPKQSKSKLNAYFEYLSEVNCLLGRFVYFKYKKIIFIEEHMNNIVI